MDSSVAAKLMQEAIGDRFHAVFIDNGLMRMNENVEVEKTLNEGLHVNLHVVDKSETFLSALKGVSLPEEKRKVIGRLFIEAFRSTALEITKATDSSEKIEWLVSISAH